MLGSIHSGNAESVDWTSDAPMPPPDDSYSPRMYQSPVPPQRPPYDQRFYPQQSSTQYPQGQFSPHPSSSSYMNSPMSVQTYAGSTGPYSNYSQMIQSPVHGSQSAPPPMQHSPNPTIMPMPALQNLSLNPTGERRGITLKQMEDFPNTIHVFPDAINEVPIAPRTFADFVDGDPWCQIKLYELETPDTKIFKTDENLFWVDGFCSTTKPQRFSIGALNTPGLKFTSVRSQIGQGIRVEQKGDDVYVINEGKGTIFIQCPNYAKQQQDADGTVYRISGAGEPGNQTPEESRTVKVFDFQLFKKFFESAANPGALANICSMCITRISFLKGFGSNYPKRPIIAHCPVWIEMQLLKRLWQIDKRIDEFPQPIPQPEDLF